MSAHLLEVDSLAVHYPLGSNFGGGSAKVVRAVADVSFRIESGETLGLVGESGCGKSTVGKAILRLVKPTGGSIQFEGTHLETVSRSALHVLRQKLQVVFQDPYSSLNPHFRAFDIVAEPLRNYKVAKGSELQDRVADLFKRVGLQPGLMTRFPHEFSGGQRQRLGIARAIALRPRLIICDEPVSALDVSIQAQVLNLLMDLQQQDGISYLFIAHDLAVVECISDRVAVMYLGRIMEIANKRSLFARPRHPYTKALLAAVPVPDPTIRRDRIILKGDVPSPIDPPGGCPFHPRCPFVFERCKNEVPKLRATGDGGEAACHLEESH
jgi:oligopeptide/dipeptide ABC transporter ATP-binding protein